MIKFFRRIRHKLLSENEISKYFFYAIGEIILVILGILIALQINNWNSKRLEHQREKVYLIRLQNELAGDTSFMNVQIGKLEYGIESIKQGIQKAYENQFTKAQIQDLLGYHNFVTESLTINKTTYDDLVNTQNLNVIRNDRLRSRIVEYYRNAEHASKAIDNFNGNVWDLQINWMTANPLAKYYPWNINMFSDSQLYYKEDFSFINEPTSYQFKLLETMQILFLNKNQGLLPYYADLKEESVKIINLISHELN